MLKRFFAFALAAITISACETEVDLNAPYQEYTTVYGLLDLSADTQKVRINKSFLGEGSAYDFAQIPDSSEYQPDEVEAYIEFGNQSVQLEPHYVDREPGVFYNEDVLVFITTENLIVNNQGSPININTEYNNLPNEYKLVVNVNGKTITGSTEPVYLINSGSADQPNPNVDLNWGSTSDNGDSFISTYVEKTNVAEGVLYDAKIIFHYTDYYVGNTEGVKRSFEFNLGTTESVYGSSGDEISFAYSSESIINHIANNVSCDNIAYRTIQPVEFVMTVAGKDLGTYISVNNPVTGVVTERPDFSNLEGENVLGLFSSRFSSVLFKELSSNSRELLFNGFTTGQLCFCDPSSATYDCPDINTPCNCSN